MSSAPEQYWFCCLTGAGAVIFFFFLNDPAPPEISPLPLHAALPISTARRPRAARTPAARWPRAPRTHRIPPARRPTRGLRGPPALASSYAPPYPETPAGTFLRSEEHTSELQSRLHLVCRLLLEKKKN